MTWSAVFVVAFAVISRPALADDNPAQLPQGSPEVEPTPIAPSFVPALVSTGITSGAVVLAVIAHGKAADRADLAQFALTQESYDADRDAVSQWNSVTGVSIGIAAAGAAVTGYLFYRAFSARSQVEVNATSQGGAIAISGRW